MSKPNAKQPTQAAGAAQEPAPQPAPASTAAPAADAPGAVVLPAPTVRDEHHGKGGMYTRINGVRTLVERTQQPGQTTPATSKE